jgi:hypothetical protein
MNSITFRGRLFIGLIALLAWFALFAQLYIHFTMLPFPVKELIIRYFSYFTILSNILVAISCTMLFIGNGTGRFFHRQSVVAAITIYIVIVGAVYNLVLRSVWDPKGLQKVVDELFHTVNPILYLLMWIFLAGKDQLAWKMVFPWLIYPIVYCIFILIRGQASGFYPYPFINVTELGMTKTLQNIGILSASFLVVSLLCIAIGKRMSKR